MSFRKSFVTKYIDVRILSFLNIIHMVDKFLFSSFLEFMSNMTNHSFWSYFITERGECLIFIWRLWFWSYFNAHFSLNFKFKLENFMNLFYLSLIRPLIMVSQVFQELDFTLIPKVLRGFFYYGLGSCYYIKSNFKIIFFF